MSLEVFCSDVIFPSGPKFSLSVSILFHTTNFIILFWSTAMTMIIVSNLNNFHKHMYILGKLAKFQINGIAIKK